jgi:hypothetical protein
MVEVDENKKRLDQLLRLPTAGFFLCQQKKPRMLQYFYIFSSILQEAKTVVHSFKDKPENKRY